MPGAFYFLTELSTTVYDYLYVRMTVFDIKNKNIDKFNLLCDRFHVEKLYAFGSSITPNFDESNSDIDLLAIINSSDPLQKGEYLLSLWDSLEDFFDRRVDLVTPESINNPYFKKEIDLKKRLIYDRQREKISV